DVLRRRRYINAESHACRTAGCTKNFRPLKRRASCHKRNVKSILALSRKSLKLSRTPLLKNLRAKARAIFATVLGSWTLQASIRLLATSSNILVALLDAWVAGAPFSNLARLLRAGHVPLVVLPLVPASIGMKRRVSSTGLPMRRDAIFSTDTGMEG